MTANTYIAHDDGQYRCYTPASDLRGRRYLGCSHRTPREAIRHKSDTYVPASRPAQNPNGTPPVTGTNRAVETASALVEAPSLVASPRGEEASPAPRPLDIEPAVGGALSLGL